MTTLRREGASRELRGALSISVIFYFFTNGGGQQILNSNVVHAKVLRSEVY